MSNLTISSPTFKNNNKILSKYTCSGEDVNPQLDITGIPEETKSLTLIADDPPLPWAIGYTR